MFNIILYQPEIPPNTGNIIRLCANAGTRLHLIKPLGFPLSDTKMRRAGLDYHEFTNIKVYDNYQHLLGESGIKTIFACTTKAARYHAEPKFTAGDGFLFGPESRGLPDEILAQFPSENKIRIPMIENSRSLNLSNAVAIITYEAWRQHGFLKGT